MKKIALLAIVFLVTTWNASASVITWKTQTPVFPIRGFHLDLRIQAMPMPAMKAFVLDLSKGGINTLIMEWEGTYPYKDEPLLSNRYVYTREEVRDFIGYCHSLHIDVIPLQQSFGHVEYILRNNKYKELREDQKDYSQINPLKENEARKLFTTLYRDLISTHNSPYIHIGGDETYLLGHSEASKIKIEALGTGRLYGDYIKMLCEIVVGLGKRPVVWADIALKYPEALQGLPKETVFIDWNYGWELNRFGDHQRLMQSGFEIWGAPAIRSHPDNYFLTQWDKHFENIQKFVPMARDLGYKGIIMTSWSTSGLYSPVFETGSDIIDLYAIRRVYPISGFHMLIAAFLQSLSSAVPLHITEFIQQYTASRYGFDKRTSGIFWKAINAVPFEVMQGRPTGTDLTIDQLRDSTAAALNVLRQLHPVKNAPEFEHYRLMAEIRLQYLAYQSIEARANAIEIPADRLKALLNELMAIRTDRLDGRFASLNKGILYPSEIVRENELRNAKLKLLKMKLQHQR